MIDDCAGEVQIFYQAGHPHGFVTSIYMGEVAVCRALGPARHAANAEAQTDPYPTGVAAGRDGQFTWGALLAGYGACKSAARGDAEYVAGCCFRSAACLMQTLFALNRRYLLNEKGVVTRAAALPLCPPALEERVQGAFGQLNGEAQGLSTALDELESVVREVEELVAGVRAATA